jgi:zinc transporter, ZIP family
MTGLVLAGLAGLGSGLALVAGAAIAWFIRVPRVVVASVMAFGSGVLISALSFDLVAEATASGSFASSMAGFLAGAVVYVGIDALMEWRGARKKRSAASATASGTGAGIVLGALLDGIPETAVQGLGLATDGALSVAVVAAVVISNLPEGLSSTADMKESGRSARFVFGIWAGIALACTASSLLGYAFLGQFDGSVTSFVTAIAAGAILAMICDTMIPEAFRDTRVFTGLIAVLGFFAGYALHQFGG